MNSVYKIICFSNFQMINDEDELLGKNYPDNEITLIKVSRLSSWLRTYTVDIVKYGYVLLWDYYLDV